MLTHPLPRAVLTRLPKSHGLAKLTDKPLVPKANTRASGVSGATCYATCPRESRAPIAIEITDNYITGSRLRLRKVRDPAHQQMDREVYTEVRAESEDLSRTIITQHLPQRTRSRSLISLHSNEIRKNRYPFELAGRKFPSTCFSAICLGWCSLKSV